MRLLVVGGSDAGIQAGLRALERDWWSPACGPTVTWPRRQGCGSRWPARSRWTPGATPLQIRLTGDRRSGRLLGAQLLGQVGAEIAKRIDVLATAIAYGASVAELGDLDLSYTPRLAAPGTRSSTPPMPGSPTPAANQPPGRSDA